LLALIRRWGAVQRPAARYAPVTACTPRWLGRRMHRESSGWSLPHGTRPRRSCGEDCACASSQRRENALLLGQGIGGQLETELLNRLSHLTLL
jgi:hypothetical protein